MNKIKVNKMIQDEVRAVIPFKDDNGKDEFIVIKNPTQKMKKDLMNKIWVGIENPKEKMTDADIIKVLLEELVNIEINMEVEDILNSEISFELQTVMYYIAKISKEITGTVLMNAELSLMDAKNKEFKRSTEKIIDELEKMKNIK